MMDGDSRHQILHGARWVVTWSTMVLCALQLRTSTGINTYLPPRSFLLLSVLPENDLGEP